jgi:hypothetical protein
MTTVIDLSTPEKMDAFGKGLMAAAKTDKPVSLAAVAEATNTLDEQATRRADLEDAIERQREQIKYGPYSNNFYETDPYGRKRDVRILRELEGELAELGGVA